MTDRQLDPEQEVEIAEGRTPGADPSGEPGRPLDVRQTPAEPPDADASEDQSTEFDRHRDAGASL